MSFDYNQTLLLASTMIRSSVVPLIIGPPGVGKTAMGDLLSKALTKPLAWINPNEFEPHELGGVMAPVGDVVKRLFPEGSELLRACQEGVLLGIDECNTLGPSKAPFLARLVNERRVGDMVLHPDTRVVLFSNNQAQSLDGNDFSLPFLNRVATINMEYAVEDFQKWLATYGEVDSPERFFAEQLSAFLDAKPDLLEIDPSKLGVDSNTSFVADIVANNASWASPRAWEKMIKFMSECRRTAGPELAALLQEDAVVEASACIIGMRQAKAYIKLRSDVKNFPTIQEICDNPTTAKLPANSVLCHSVAAMLPAIGKKNAESAWLYVNRFSAIDAGGPEIVRVLYKNLTKNCPLSPKASAAAKKVQVSMAASAKETVK